MLGHLTLFYTTLDLALRSPRLSVYIALHREPYFVFWPLGVALKEQEDLVWIMQKLGPAVLAVGFW